mmetsp:Transcript_27471/g.41418  ORF Transcript_27471/g.41418 Transcript_27471/m.41418 type:complete len:108 (+) Transcript_27471:426-749(+)
MGRSASAGTAVLFDDEVVSVENSLTVGDVVVDVAKESLPSTDVDVRVCVGTSSVRMWECLHKTIIDLRKNPPSQHPYFVISFANGKIIALLIQCDSGCPTMHYFSIR